MNTPQSPFTALQELQEEQREGYAPPRRMTPLQESMEIRQQLAEKDAKIAEQAAQIAALRGALASNRENTCELMGERHWWKDEPRCGYAEQYKAMQKDVADADVALSTPAPPVVPLEDVIPLLDALKIIAANPGASHGPSCLYDSGPISTGAIAKFNAKHLQP